MSYSRGSGFVVTNLNLPPEGVTHYYNGRGTAEQWIKEGKYALNWTRLSCHRFVANQVRLWLFVLAYCRIRRSETTEQEDLGDKL